MYGYCYITYSLTGVYNKIHIQSVYSAIRKKLKTG